MITVVSVYIIIVNEQSVELNNLKTVQAYPKEYVSLLFNEKMSMFLLLF